MRPTAVSGNVRWAGVSVALAVAGAIFLALVPTTTSVAVVAPVAGGPELVTRSTHTLLEAEGLSVLAVLAVPVLISSAGLITARRSKGTALTVLTIVYGVGIVLALASVGLFFAPSFAALALAARRATSSGTGLPDVRAA